MSKSRLISWKRIASIGLLAGTGGLLGFLAGGMTSSGDGTPEAGLKPPASSPAKKTGKTRTLHPSVEKRYQDWLTRCRGASQRSTADWAAALASTSGWMRTGNPDCRGELERFVSATQEEGIRQAMQAGVSAGFLSMAIGKQAPAMIPSLMEALLADPSLVSREDLGQMTFDATKAGSFRAAALAPLARHLLDFYPDDQLALDAFGRTVGRFDLNDVTILTDQIADEASRESILAAAVRARAASMEAGPELTQIIENSVVGVPALQAAFRNAGMSKGNAGSSPQKVGSALAWTRSLTGYKQKAALQGWIEAVREEHPVTEPLARFLTDPDSVKDAAFFTKIIELSSPALIQQGPAGVKELAALLESRPDRLTLLEAQPKLKALLETSP